MTSPLPKFSPDQAAAWNRAADLLLEAGIDLGAGTAAPADEHAARRLLAITGKAGSGKTLLLAQLTVALRAAGLAVVSGDHEGRRRKERRTLAVLSPTNKAAFVLRTRGVPATTIHRILYTPVYDPQYEKIADWLASGVGPPPATDALTAEALERARAFYAQHASIPGALATAGLRGSDFITGWKRREEGLDIGLVDEASMLDARQLEDLREIFPTLILFGDPAQLAPVGAGGGMVFDTLPAESHLHLTKVHRQAKGSPILELAHALADPQLDFAGFEALLRASAARDDRVRIAERVDVDLMPRSPVLVWRNATRVRLISAFRNAHGAPGDALLAGEPLICDGIELPLKHRRKRIDLEARGLVKGAQVVYLGPGRGPGFARLHVVGAEEPRLSAAAIIRIEQPDAAEPFIASAARMGAVFLHGGAVTIHKAQGSQWPDVQVFGPDLAAAAWSGREEAGTPLWKRLAYVAITRAQERLHWITRARLSRPTLALSTDDLDAIAPAPLSLAAPDATDAA